jgi:YegS/Rv2252/BmrU family lipid kinase
VPPTTPFDNTTTPPRDLAPPERHTARPGTAPRTSRRHIAVVFNPATSPDDAPAHKRELLAALQTAEVKVLWLETTEQDAGQGLTRQALKEGVDLVLAAGGDGTVMACVTALAGSGVPLAVLPLGTGNLLAGYLDLPEDLDGALDIALHGEHRELDVGALDGGGDRFVLMTGLGFDAAMLRDTDPKLKARIGPLAYVLSGLGQLRRRPARFRIRLDGQPPITRVGQGLLVANVGRLQGGVTVAPEAKPDDGLLDVVILKTHTPIDWLGLAAQVLLRRQRHGADQQGQADPSGSPRLPLETFRARRVEVDCNRRQPLERDGDPAGSTRRLVVQILPRALTLCVPARAEGVEGAEQADNP